MSKKIKIIRRFNQHYKNFAFGDVQQLSDKEFLESEVHLDAAGNVIEENKFSSTGELEEKNTYEFDSNGKLVSHELLYAVDDVREKRVLHRNEKGSLISEIKYYGSDAGERTEYEYNTDDHVISISHFDEEGDFVSKEEITYHDKTHIASRVTKDKNGDVISKFTFTLPEKNMIEEKEFDSQDNLVSTTVINFNTEGKELSTVQTNPQGKHISRITNIYDEQGNLTEKTVRDFYSRIFRYSYNNKNLMTEQELLDENGLLLRKNQYEYDAEGNVINEQTYEMDTSRAGRDKHFGSRYAYEFFE